MIAPLRNVVSSEEEWRTKRCENRRNSHGRVCLWVGLDCGHYVQRMRKIEKNGSVTHPEKARCDICPKVPGGKVKE